MKLAIIVIGLVACCGCSSTNITKFANAMAKDHATWVVRVMTPYGSGSYIRVGDAPNLVTSVDADGRVTQTAITNTIAAFK